ncbi:eCIS core domain-containing protein [Ruminiclostridium cellobioparum]|uniref:eCIS core domain-containing protein n=1 Tax=Ruminiclostridium cellobioparum TaxID=29355 RepID=UPI0028AE8BD5|nr:DUF4157 domain-containing protein [Ruminiclostridium cellobioparum]
MIYSDKAGVFQEKEKNTSSSRKSGQKPVPNHSAILQRVRMFPKTMTHEDIKILQKTIGNQAVHRLMREIGLIKGKTEQTKRENETGLPDDLKNGIEILSGLSMENVRVNYNSDKPAQLGASAYTQGPEIYVAPGQDKRLPHEAWHVVQQSQGRVKPAMQISGVQINNDEALELEAENMGDKAGRIKAINGYQEHEHANANGKKTGIPIKGTTVQCDGIGFTSSRGRGKIKEIPISELNEAQLNFIIENKDHPTIAYCPPEKKDELFAQVKARLDAIKEARLKKQTDGGLGYHHSSTRYVVAQYPPQSGATKADIQSAYSALPFEVVEPRSPLVYSAYPPERVHSPGGSEAHLSGPYVRPSGGGYSGVAIWAANFPERLPQPAIGMPIPLSKKPVPCTVAVKESGWQEIGLDRLKRWSGERVQYKPGPGADPGERSDQNAAMGNVPAKAAAGDAGYVDGFWEWLHLIAFTLGGINENKINHPENLVAGTLGANRVHKVLEDTIKKLIVDDHTKKILVFARAHILASSYHLCNKLEYKLKFDYKGSAKEFSFEINPLDINPAQGGNMEIIERTILTRPGF